MQQRSIDFLTPEQLQRKRDRDRRSQRQNREQTLAYIKALETKVRELGQTVEDLERKSANLEHQISSLLEQYNAHQQNQGWANVPLIQGCGPATETPVFDGMSAQDFNWELIDGNCPTLENSTLWGRVLGDTIFATPECNPQRTGEYSLTLPAPLSSADISSSEEVWSTLPKHTPSTCDLDTVVINLIQQRRQLESTGGNVSEFTRHAFPSIQSLLNPTYQPLESPVTSTIVKNIIHVMTVPTLPEQIAILYVMSKVIRWQISPTQANYFDLPEWLRPTPSQLVYTHPPWLDLFLWPKAREKLCREKKYYKEHERMAEICNATLSINWPHKPSDMIMQVSGRETVLHPIFEKHILDLGNWTVGKKILEAYPDLVFEVNIKP